MPVSVPPASHAGSRSIQSPTTPPSPAGNGQAVLRGNALAHAAASSTPRIQNAKLMRSRRIGRLLASRQPQIAIGSMSASEATPNSCMSRSATIAPYCPNALCTGLLVAWLNEGSCTDQVASAIASRIARPISARPPSSRSRRCSASRTASGRKLRLSRPRSMTDKG